MGKIEFELALSTLLVVSMIFLSTSVILTALGSEDDAFYLSLGIFGLIVCFVSQIWFILKVEVKVED